MPRPLLLLALLPLGLSGCGYTPQQLGITGPGTGRANVTSHASEADEDARPVMPGLPVGSSGVDTSGVPLNFGAPADLQGFGNGNLYQSQSP